MTSSLTSLDFTLAVHGGAGTILRSKMTPEREAAYHAGLRRALDAGRAVLADGGTAIDGVTAAVMALEDEPLFNAGRGAVYTSAGKQEMDAAIMDGRDRAAGAIAGICGPRNPILAARAVMEKSDHVFLIGESAMDFCRQHGIAFEEASYFFTEQRWNALQETLAMRRSGADDQDESRKHGTVGAVARDRHGHLAAATSTGGMTGKAPGRVGDSPVIGAGTWADDATCAISATGSRRNLHPLCRLPRDCVPPAPCGRDSGRSGARCRHRRSRACGRVRRADRGGQKRGVFPAFQLFGNVSRRRHRRRDFADRDLRRAVLGVPIDPQGVGVLQ